MQLQQMPVSNALRIGIATFNAENLIGPGKKIYSSTHALYSKEQYQQKVSWISAQIAQLSASIIGFQEVFEDSALKDCLSSEDKWDLLIAPGDGSLPRNALISKFKIVQSEVFGDLPSPLLYFDEFIPEDKKIELPVQKFSRAVLKAKLELDKGLYLNVLVVHLKSKNPILADGIKRSTGSFYDIATGSVRSLIRRGIEACGLRKIVSDLLLVDPDTPVVILGDFNDDSYSVTNQLILGEKPYFTLDKDAKVQRWQGVLQNSRSIQARKSIESHLYSYIYNGHYEMLDNIVVSNHFSDLNPNRLGRVLDVKAFNDHLTDDTMVVDAKTAASDHGQVLALIEINLPAT
jgi:endonuclease/exonuclease/phosphatase family metal-dependent hydrolase